MRNTVIAALIALAAAGPAFAQSMPAKKKMMMHHGTHAASRPLRASGLPAGSTGVPIDHGPNTPEANSAYQGGGMVLEGAPGAPPPRPEPTPPGQMPRNMVPQ